MIQVIDKETKRIVATVPNDDVNLKLVRKNKKYKFKEVSDNADRGKPRPSMG